MSRARRAPGENTAGTVGGAHKADVLVRAAGEQGVRGGRTRCTGRRARDVGHARKAHTKRARPVRRVRSARTTSAWGTRSGRTGRAQ